MDVNSMIIRGGNVVLPDRVLPCHDVVVRDGVIDAILPFDPEATSVRPVYFAGADDTGTPGFDVDTIKGLPVVDAQGAYVTPGMIDIHSDYIESVACPRPTAILDLPSSLYKCDRELVGYGITTIFHSLSVYGLKIFDHKPIRDFPKVRQLVDLVAAMAKGEERDHLIRHRMHLRVELDSVDLVEEVRDCLARGKVNLLSFMDHTPGQGQYRDLRVFSETLKGYRDLDDQEVADIVRAQQEGQKITYRQMEDLAALAARQGVNIASHDDDSEDKLEVMTSLGASISEFPIDMAVAKSSRRRGMHAIAGAPNVLMGHSHSGNLSAREAVMEGAVDVLCSDYSPSALLDAVFVLHRVCGLDLARAFALVTVNPAKAVGMDDMVGSLEPGKRADILVVREIGTGDGDATMPVITRAFVGGHSVYRTHYPCQHFGYGGPGRAVAGSRAAVPGGSAESGDAAGGKGGQR